MDSTFSFDFHARVRLSESEETGTVVGRAEYVDTSPTYRVRYRDAQGRHSEAWFNGSELAPA